MRVCVQFVGNITWRRNGRKW